MLQLASKLKLFILKFMFHTLGVISNNEKNRDLIYILPWAGIEDEPVMFWSKKQKSLISNDCEYKNCFIVKDRDYFLDVTDYDVVLFNVAKLGEQWPSARSDNQLYVLVAREPAAYWAIVGDDYNWFFNYTWTYRLDSDIVYPYFIVKDKKGNVVGPKINAKWKNVTRMKPTPQNVIDKLKNKTTAAAWFITNCYSYNKRLFFGQGIHYALKKYNLSLDIYGRCGNKVCLKVNKGYCIDLVEKYYYFYLAFENSNCEDYVTEKLMTALDHYTVPIVLGGANYSRFMPNGIYINGNTLTEDDIAKKIYYTISDKQKYYDYFKWHRYYTYQRAEGGPTDPLCAFCAFLNSETVRNQRRVYARIDKWWNEFKTREDDDVIVKYEDNSPFIKSVITYTDTGKSKSKLEAQPESSSGIEQVNSFFDDIVNYYFGQ